MEKLLPCPFCGSTDIDKDGVLCIDGKTSPCCMSCGATAESIEQWNKRKQTQLPDFGKSKCDGCCYDGGKICNYSGEGCIKDTPPPSGCGKPGHVTATGDEGTSYCQTCQAEAPPSDCGKVAAGDCPACKELEQQIEKLLDGTPEKDKEYQYNKGVHDGRATQAIMELQARDKFLSGLRVDMEKLREENKALQAELTRPKGHNHKLLTACEFATGAIRDAIGNDDGLDGSAGEAVLKMIDEAMKNIGELPCDNCISKAELIALRQSNKELREVLKLGYNLSCYAAASKIKNTTEFRDGLFTEIAIFQPKAEALITKEG